MTLKEWMAEQSMTVPQFAVLIGRTAESVRRYVAGDRIPDKETMPAIAIATGGRVTPNDFFDLSLSPAPCDSCTRASAGDIAACTSVACPMRQAEAA